MDVYRKDVIFILCLIVPFYFFVTMILVPYTTDYAFQTVTRFQGNYTDPIYLTFHWKTADELMVGKYIRASVDVRNLPYNETSTLKDITIKYNQLNYFSNRFDEENNRISDVDYVTLRPDWDRNVFRSNEISIRYIVPQDVSIDLCDYNLQRECMEIKSIIHPAPHDTFVHIDNARTSIAVSLSILTLSIITAWFNLRSKYGEHKKLSSRQLKMLAIGLSLIIIIIIGTEYFLDYYRGDIT